MNKQLGDAAETLTATVEPADAPDKSLTWSSDKPAVATVADGVVTVVGVGTAIIKAIANDGSGVEATCTVNVTIPGLLAGKFSVSATKQVQFSKGNLRYDKSTSPATWSFFDDQYQFYLGYNASLWDKFGWVATTSTVLTSAPDKYGVSTSTTFSDYGSTITDTPNNWGETMGAGWRVLTDAEWTYLFNTRTTGGTVFGTASARYAQAEVNTDGVATKGIILFPDGVDIAATEVATAGTVNNTSDWGTKCTIDQWTALADKGCVFLPAAGRRNGSTFNFGGTVGYYWTSSPYISDAKDAYVVYFSSDNLHPYYSGSRYFGCSVRLVRDVQ